MNYNYKMAFVPYLFKSFFFRLVEFFRHWYLNSFRIYTHFVISLLEKLDKAELEGVIAHGLSHIGNKDMLLMTMVVVLVGFIGIISNFFTRSLLFGGTRKRDG